MDDKSSVADATFTCSKFSLDVSGGDKVNAARVESVDDFKTVPMRIKAVLRLAICSPTLRED
jgi:hypothetical protein